MSDSLTSLQPQVLVLLVCVHVCGGVCACTNVRMYRRDIRLDRVSLS